MLSHTTMRAGLGLVVVFLGCGRFSALAPIEEGIDASPGQDAAQSPQALPCDPFSPFDPPQLLGGFDPGQSFADIWLSPDELTIYFTSTDGLGNEDIYSASRLERSGTFGNPISAGVLNTAAPECCPTVSENGLIMVYQTLNKTGEGFHLFVASRPSTIAEFGPPSSIAGVASPDVRQDDLDPVFAAHDKELWFVSDRTGTRHIFRATLSGGTFVNATAISELISSRSEVHPVLSDDLLTIYFASNRDTMTSKFEIFRAHRETVQAAFDTPKAVEELRETGSAFPRWLSPDGCRLYLFADLNSATQVYIASRHPPS